LRGLTSMRRRDRDPDKRETHAPPGDTDGEHPKALQDEENPQPDIADEWPGPIQPDTRNLPGQRLGG
jgi:hypothetical protein